MDQFFVEAVGLVRGGFTDLFGGKKVIGGDFLWGVGNLFLKS